MKLEELEALTSCYAAYGAAGPYQHSAHGRELTKQERSENKKEMRKFKTTLRRAGRVLRAEWARRKKVVALLEEAL